LKALLLDDDRGIFVDAQAKVARVLRDGADQAAHPAALGEV
jgi:hypothetical protein